MLRTLVGLGEGAQELHRPGAAGAPDRRRPAGRPGPRGRRRAVPDLRPQPPGLPGHPRDHDGRVGGCRRRHRPQRRRPSARLGIRPLAALPGALVTGVLLFLLTWRAGIDGYRLVLVGIALWSVGTALVDWLLTNAEIYDAASAYVWITGRSTPAPGTTPCPWRVALAVLAAARPRAEPGAAESSSSATTPPAASACGSSPPRRPSCSSPSAASPSPSPRPGRSPSSRSSSRRSPSG